MYTIYLFAIIVAVCAILAIVINVVDRCDDFFGIKALFASIAVLVFLGGFITGFTLINIDTRFEAIQNEYEVINQMIDSYDGQDYGNMTALTEAVVSMNDKIAQHKAHYKSKWTGLWYSEDIANLQPIVFSKKVPTSE